MDTEVAAMTSFIDHIQRLSDLSFDLPHNGIYPKPKSKGLRELNRDACQALVQADLTIQHGTNSGILRPTNLQRVVMRLLNDAALLMSWLQAMRDQGEITERTWRSAQRLHQALWTSVGNPPHNEF